MSNYKVQNKTFSCWTEAQDYAMKHLDNGVEYVSVLIWNEKHNDWGLLQELNLERGIFPEPHFSTWTLAPYYVRLNTELLRN